MRALVHERRRHVLRSGRVLARQAIEDGLVLVGIFGIRTFDGVSRSAHEIRAELRLDAGKGARRDELGIRRLVAVEGLQALAGRLRREHVRDRGHTSRPRSVRASTQSFIPMSRSDSTKIGVWNRSARSKATGAIEAFGRTRKGRAGGALYRRARHRRTQECRPAGRVWASPLTDRYAARRTPLPGSQRSNRCRAAPA